jgi:hypothetical protein
MKAFLKITVEGIDFSNLPEGLFPDNPRTWVFECCRSPIHGVQVLPDEQLTATCPRCDMKVVRPKG